MNTCDKRFAVLFLWLIILFINTNSIVSGNNADATISKLQTKLEKAAKDTSRLNAMLDISKYYLQLNSDSSLIYAKKAYKLSERIHYKKVASSFNLGRCYDFFDDFYNAKKYFFKAYDEAQKSGNNKELFSILSCIGNSCYMLEDDTEALNYFNKAFALAYNYESHFNALINLGSVHTALENYTKAEDYLNKALKLSTYKNNKNDISYTYNRFGDVYFMLEKDDTSLYFFQKALRIAGSENILLKSHSMVCIARGYLATSQFDKGIKIAREAESLLQSNKNITASKDIYEYLSMLYDSVGQPQMALKYHRMYLELKDSIFNIEKNKQLSFLNVEFETKQKEIQIENLEQENRFRKILGLTYVIVGLLIIMVMFYLIKNYRQKNKILALEKERISQQKEKEILDKKKLKLKLLEKDREILTHILQINQQKEVLTDVRTEIDEIIHNYKPEEIQSSVAQLKSSINTRINLSDDWKQIKLHFEKIHPNFFSSLKTDFPDLTLNDLKYCAYSKLRFSSKEISRIMNINPRSVQVSRYRLKKKMNIPEEINFNDYIEAR